MTQPTTITLSRETVDKVREALKVFAIDAQRALSSVPDHDKLRVVYAHYAPNGCVGEIEAGDFRKAAAALALIEQEILK